MSSFSAQASNPMGDTLGVDDIELRNPESPKVDIVATFTNAFELVKQFPAETIGGAFIMMMAIGIVNIGLTVVQSIVIGILSSAVSSTGSEGAMYAVIGVQLISQILMTIIVLIVQSIIGGGYYIMWMRIVRGEEVTFNNMMDVKPFILPLVLAALVMQFAIGFGMLLLIVPGVILSLGLWFSPLVVVDKNLGAIDALKASWRITDGYKMDIFLFGILMMVVNFVGAIPCFLGLILTIPMSMGAMVSFYSQIAAPGRAYAEHEQHLRAFE